jgi:hypothetical protein
VKPWEIERLWLEHYRAMVKVLDDQVKAQRKASRR